MRRSISALCTAAYVRLLGMQEVGVLLVARCPDPKLAKAGLAPFHTAADGTTTTSGSGV
jgi:hypothetical protein